MQEPQFILWRVTRRHVVFTVKEANEELPSPVGSPVRVGTSLAVQRACAEARA